MVALIILAVVVSFFFGYILCALFTTRSLDEEYLKGFDSGVLFAKRDIALRNLPIAEEIDINV